MDESGFTLNYPLMRCWMKQAEQKRLPANTQVRSGCLMAGVIDYLSGQAWCQVIEKLDTQSLITYFEWLFNVIYPTESMVIVMDNARTHHARALQAFLALHPRVQVLFLPAYSPDMNLIERFWLHLKQRITYNRLFASITDMILALQTELVQQNCFDYEFRFNFSKD